MKLTGKDFTVNFDGCEIEAVIDNGLSVHTESGSLVDFKREYIKWPEREFMRIGISGINNYKLMTSKSKVGKRKVLVRLIGETK